MAETLIDKLKKVAFPARDISDDMNMGEAVRLDQIEEIVRQHEADRSAAYEKVREALESALKQLNATNPDASTQWGLDRNKDLIAAAKGSVLAAHALAALTAAKEG